jgi:DNA-binding response OmpR family regulator
MHTVLVVEDDRAMQRVFERTFSTEDCQVQVAPDGPSGLGAFRNERPSVVVLDLKLPGKNGRDLCREFKSTSPRVPVIVVSASSEVADKVLLLELGADDYVTKPFSPKELLARVRRALQRTDVSLAQGFPLREYRFADVVVDCGSMEVKRSGKIVALTKQEFRLLQHFLQHSNRVFSRDDLLNSIWGYKNYSSSRTVDSHVVQLRQKLEPDPSNPKHFLTLHGLGYKFVA